MEFSLYIGSTKAKHAIKYTFSKYICTRLSRYKWKCNLDKTPKRSRSHKVWKLKIIQIISKNPINTRLTPKFNKWTTQKPKRHMLKNISHLKNDKEWDKQLPKRARFQQTNQTLHTFYDGTQSTKKKRFVFQQQPIPIKISTKSVL
jgi:hypothetical protein